MKPKLHLATMLFLEKKRKRCLFSWTTDTGCFPSIWKLKRSKNIDTLLQSRLFDLYGRCRIRFAWHKTITILSLMIELTNNDLQKYHGHKHWTTVRNFYFKEKTNYFLKVANKLSTAVRAELCDVAYKFGITRNRHIEITNYFIKQTCEKVKCGLTGLVFCNFLRCHTHFITDHNIRLALISPIE